MQTLVYSPGLSQGYLLWPVVTDYARLAAYYSSAHHLHKVYHIVYIMEGKGWLDTDTGRIGLEKEKIVIINPRARHVFITRKEQLYYYAFNFYLVALPRLKKVKDLGKGLATPFLEKQAETAPLERLFGLPAHGIFLDYRAGSWFGIINYIRNFQYAVSDHVSSLYLGTKAGRDQAWYLHHCFNFFTTMFFNFLKSPTGSQAPDPAGTDPLVQKVTDWLDRRIGEKLDLTALARSLEYNPSYLCTSFRQRTGLTLSDYFHRMKVRAACEHLRSSGHSITDLALTLGYSSSQHFCTRFRRIKGLAPNQYRKRTEMY